MVLCLFALQRVSVAFEHWNTQEKSVFSKLGKGNKFSIMDMGPFSSVRVDSGSYLQYSHTLSEVTFKIKHAKQMKESKEPSNPLHIQG